MDFEVPKDMSRLSYLEKKRLERLQASKVKRTTKDALEVAASLDRTDPDTFNRVMDGENRELNHQELELERIQKALKIPQKRGLKTKE